LQLGFVIDHTRCIGCHACTVACKSENDVPLGNFRTWVKYTEGGEFPEVKRDFAVLRCNQCTDAPCIDICPTAALVKRPDGIVDLNPDHCIGCKSCMHGCPYDALYINPHSGLAEKCHFCAHRTEIGLAPACAVVCPTEAIIPGDFDDPESRVSQLRDGGGLEARKPEAGTQPNVLYREVAEAGIDPSLTNLSSGFIWSQNPTGERLQVQAFEQAQAQDDLARTVYDVPRERLWGSKITGYLFFKSISAGAFPVAFVAWLAAGSPDASQGMPAGLPAVVAMLGLLITSALLVADLKRPSRFWMILVRPNMKSWLARGTFVLAGYGALLSLWLLLGLMDVGSGVLRDGILGSVTVFLGIMAAAYTGWLFSQAKGRVLWMKRYYWLELACQALVAGGATLMCLQFVAQFEPEVLLWIRRITLLGLAGEGLLILSEGQRAPKNREAEYARVLSLLHKGPYSTMHHMLVACGVAAPILVLIFAPGAALIASLAILVCLWMREELFVRAGQALPIS
jgi:Fe-S-cluster-containing dehydrogenase component/predicted membrane protein